MTANQPTPGLRGAWRHSTIESLWADAQASVDDPCEVVITDNGLSLSYVDDEFGHVVYRGEEREPGHWKLHGSHGGQGSLHGFSDGGRLEGYWTLRGWRGMWTVTLSDDPDDA